QLEAIILHELSHIKRNDYLINLLISLIETILFFNPFIVLLIKIIKKERENCCDDFVLQYQYDRHSYASALLSLEQSRNQHLRLALTSTSGKKQLLSRIKRIMEVKNITHSFNYGQKLLALITITGIICSVAWLSPGKQSHFYTKISKKKLTDTKSWMLNNTENIHLKTDNQKQNTLLHAKPDVIKKKLIVPENISEAYSETDDDNLTRRMKKKTYSAFISDNEPIHDIRIMKFENNKPLIVKSLPDHALSFAFNDNLFLQQFWDIDFQLLQNLRISIDINNLKHDIEKGYHSLSNIDWDNINEDINESQANIKNSGLEMIMSEKQKKVLINQIEKHKQKNIQRQLQRQLQHSPKDIMPWNKKLIDVDSLIYENMGIYKVAEDRIFFREIQDNYSYAPQSPVKRKRSITVPPPALHYQFSPPENSSYNYYYMVKKKKRSEYNKMQVEREDEVIIINGKNINSSRLNKHRSAIRDKKILIDVSNNEF
ncbi:MAG: M56 family metallopeptidase, partial [Chitinophagaceae bacterium]|nr:M56 family metallopeptidase [Chitinophagaceae bacterium]